MKEGNSITHHYVIAIKCYEIDNPKFGQVYMKYHPIYWTNKDRDNFANAIQLNKDKLLPSGVSMREALKICNCDDSLFSLHALKFGAKANSCTIHHFESKEEIEEEWFDMLAENYKSNKRLFEQSRITL